MELEHTNLGHHCEVISCNQRDFLPFTCDICKRKLCLLHRSYAAHTCAGENSKDITSIDCPICGKSVKFSQAQSTKVDEIWEEHYLTNCSREKAPLKITKICFKSSCTTVLGLSNIYRCKKCNKDVCLQHRVPEEHSCISLNNYAKDRSTSKLLQTENKNKIDENKNENIKKNPIAQKNKISKSSHIVDLTGENSLKGSADRRRNNVGSIIGNEGNFGNEKNGVIDTNNANNGYGNSHGNGNGNDNGSRDGNSQFSCPLCSFVAVESVLLESHFMSFHPDNNGNGNGNNNGNSSNNYSSGNDNYNNGNNNSSYNGSNSNYNGYSNGHGNISNNNNNNNYNNNNNDNNSNSNNATQGQQGSTEVYKRIKIIYV